MFTLEHDRKNITCVAKRYTYDVTGVSRARAAARNAAPHRCRASSYHTTPLPLYLAWANICCTAPPSCAYSIVRGAT